MDNNFSSILDIFKKLNEGTMDSAETQSTGPKFTGYWKGTDAKTPGNKMVGAAESIKQECSQPASLADKLRARWEETKAQKGLTEYGMTTDGTAAPGAPTPPPAPGAPAAPTPPPAPGAPAAPTTTNTVPADPAVAAKQKADMQKSLQGIPGVDANKAVTDLTNPKDVSGLNVAIANALANPATAQKAKDLLATGMKTGQPGGV